MKTYNLLSKHPRLFLLLLTGLVTTTTHGIRGNLANNPKEALIDPFWVVSGSAAKEEGIDIYVPLKNNLYLLHTENPVLNMQPIPRSYISLEDRLANTFWELGGAQKKYSEEEPEAGTLAFTAVPDGIKRLLGTYTLSTTNPVSHFNNNAINSIIIQQALGVKIKSALPMPHPHPTIPPQPTTSVKLDLTKLSKLEDPSAVNTCLKERLEQEISVGKQITQIDLRDVSLSDESLQVIVDRCPNLTYLNLWSSHITNISPLQHLPHLAYLNIGNTSVSDLSPLRSCPNLTTLYLGFCYQIKDISPLQHLLNLDELHLRNCNHITDFSYLQYLTNLTKLYLTECSVVSNAVIEDIAKKCHKMVVLNISVTKVNDTGLETIAQNCPDLTELDVMTCDQVSDTGIEDIARKCHNITRLGLSITKISDTGLKTIADHCPELTELLMWDANNISELGIMAIVGKCKKLKKLILSGCKNVSRQYLNELQCNYRDIELIY